MVLSEILLLHVIAKKDTFKMAQIQFVCNVTRNVIHVVKINRIAITVVLILFKLIRLYVNAPLGFLKI
jgi:hypothetical protein